jgi:hypothetical protein
MLISEFARITGLTRDTVRFYARRGLLQPETNDKGGRLDLTRFCGHLSVRFGGVRDGREECSIYAGF